MASGGDLRAHGSSGAAAQRSRAGEDVEDDSEFGVEVGALERRPVETTHAQASEKLPSGGCWRSSFTSASSCTYARRPPRRRPPSSAERRRTASLPCPRRRPPRPRAPRRRPLRPRPPVRPRSPARPRARTAGSGGRPAGALLPSSGARAAGRRRTRRSTEAATTGKIAI